jgi:uncharacterized protein (TIGR00730 family)
MHVTIFGGAQPKPGDTAYEEARRLGMILAQAGHTVLTGGYIGTMEAVSRGACEAGGHVIGVTCQEIENFRPSRANAWVKEERRFTSLMERLKGLIDGCDAAMALPGGAGTLTEIALVWNLLIIGAIPTRPLILIGPGWQATLETFFRHFGIYVSEVDQHLLVYASNVDDAFQKLEEFKTLNETANP